MSSLHVLTLTPFYPQANDDANGCFVFEPLQWLGREGIRNTVFAVQPMYRGRMRASGNTPRANCFSYFALPGGLGLPTSGRFLYAQILKEVRQKRRLHPIDLVHAHGALPCGHAAALLSEALGIPYVVSVHGLDAYSTVQVRGYTGRWCERISRMVYSSAKGVICISEHVRKAVRDGALHSPPTAVVYNGVDASLFAPGYEFLGTSDPVILSVGNLIPTKGHELLIRAVAILKDQHPNLSCEIIGDGPERRQLALVASHLNVANRVRFVGRKNRLAVAGAMRRCTIFALTSRYEGLGCVYLEAMSSEKPAIGCQGQGIEEIIEHNVNGCLTNPGNLEELVFVISNLLQNESLRTRIGRAARRTVLRGLTLAHQAERLSSVYRECLA